MVADTYQDFIEICKQISKDTEAQIVRYNLKMMNDTKHIFYGWYEFLDENDSLSNIKEYAKVTFETGGYSGGNCYGDEAEEYTVEEQRLSLDNFLNAVVLHQSPNVPYSVFTKEILKLVKTSCHTDGGYYGNYVEYETHHISLEDFYNFLKKYDK